MTARVSSRRAVLCADGPVGEQTTTVSDWKPVQP